jgi:hypothetical protein
MNEHKELNKSRKSDSSTVAGEAGPASVKRRYARPEFLSCEPLEALAAVCPTGPDPNGFPLPTGKNVQEGGCVSPGS